MKRLIYSFLLLLAIAGCARDESELQIVGDPYFSINVLEEGSVPLKEMDPMSAQYTLEMSANGYSASENAANHVSKALRFHISSNLRWKIVPTDEENVPDWIIPYPESGEKDGIFFFKTDRNIDPVNSRETYYNILVDKGSGVYEPIEGILHVIQAESQHFLEMSAARFSVAAAGQTISLRVKANVPWTYSLNPSEEYATESMDWIEDKSDHAAEHHNDTLVFAVAANDKGMRGVLLNISYELAGVEKTDVVSITQYPENEVYLEGFPVKWLVRVDGNTFADTFPSEGTGAAVSGNGLIRFNNECGKAADTKGNVKLDISDKSPRATGVWPGDYCEFIAAAPVSAGTIVKIAFATRSSAGGPKYWRLEYRDGESWKIAGKSYVEDGVTFTHAMNPDGSTNVLVETAVTYENATDQVEFRFICASTHRASGAAPPTSPGTATWRLSVDNADANDPYQPTISIVAAGGEPPVQANMSVNTKYLYFESSPSESKTFRVTSDQDFVIRSEQPWIHVDKEQESAGENVTVTVTCDRYAGTKGREGFITILAGITRQQVAILQGAASADGSGQIDLEPFVSVVSGNNVNVGYKRGSVEVDVLSNMELSYRVSDGWVTVSKATSTRAAAEYSTYVLNYSENPSAEQERTVSVCFYNGKVESVVTLTQAKNIFNKTIYFEDDFYWLMPFVEEYKKQSDDGDTLDPVGSNISSHAQPNIWSKLSDTVGKAFTENGYIDLNPGATTLYVQDCYLKMGAGGRQTGITLPALNFEGATPVDVILSFDWCAHMSASGNIDNVPLVVSLSGPGTCADTGKQVSNPFKTTQTKGHLEWQPASLVLRGVTEKTRISLKPNFATFAESGNHRWHLDNILIIKND